MAHRTATSPRQEYLAQEKQRVMQSPPLAEKFPALKSMVVDLDNQDPASAAPTNQVRFTVNIDHAKSVFRVGCPNPECVRGDFDLTEPLASAIAARQTTVTSKLRCRGWRNRSSIDSVRCGKVLHYTLKLGY
jgi:hypothetical protein